MKEELLKSVAQPMQVFFAPFGLFLLNVVITFILMVLFLISGFGVYMWIPVLFFVILHFVAVVIGKKEPHIDNIIASRKNIKARTKNLIKENGNKFTA